MKAEEIFSKNLPKWPALVAVGSTLTAKQAMEVIIRTDSFLEYPCTNDKAWQEEAMGILGILDTFEHRDNFKEVYRQNESRRKSLQHLQLHYLTNHRIASSWIGGAYGWCQWIGNIYSNNYNIGKWPSIQEVHEDCQTLAKAFPFLQMKLQLWSGEAAEDDIIPVVEWSISKGRTYIREPKEDLGKPCFNMNQVVNNLNSLGRERGCTADQLRVAVLHVEHVLHNEKTKRKEAVEATKEKKAI